ncbi:MAG: hypothetical protein ABIR87_03730 [Sphingomicrobium sp.]
MPPVTKPPVAVPARAVPTVAAPSLVGAYRLHQGPDVASELVLKADGTFEYFLAAGSLDEMATGTWRADGQLLRLQTMPKPVPPVFSAGPATSEAGATLAIHVTAPSGQGIAAVNFVIGFDDGEPVRDYTQDYGWHLADDEKRVPRWIEFSLTAYNLKSQRFAIDRAKGNALSFILTPNDLGVIDFSGVEIHIEPRVLVVHRWGSTMRYEARQTD